MKIIDLDYLQNVPLSTQLERLSGSSWNSLDWTSQDGGGGLMQTGHKGLAAHTYQCRSA